MPDILQVDIFATFEMYDVMPSLRGKAVAAKTLSGYVICQRSLLTKLVVKISYPIPEMTILCF